jgi:hypothetical protein
LNIIKTKKVSKYICNTRATFKQAFKKLCRQQNTVISTEIIL